jgi:hypothetical protein
MMAPKDSGSSGASVGVAATTMSFGVMCERTATSGAAGMSVIVASEARGLDLDAAGYCLCFCA